MTEQAEIIALLREIRDLLADERREQHDAQPENDPDLLSMTRPRHLEVAS